jgi:hypothetical protein
MEMVLREKVGSDVQELMNHIKGNLSIGGGKRVSGCG